MLIAERLSIFIKRLDGENTVGPLPGLPESSFLPCRQSFVPGARGNIYALKLRVLHQASPINGMHKKVAGAARVARRRYMPILFEVPGRHLVSNNNF